VRTLGLGTRGAVITSAVIIGALASLFAATGAAAGVKTFSHVAKTRKALVFKIDGVSADAVRGASAVLRYPGGKQRRKDLSLRSVRRAAETGRLRIRRGPARVRDRRSSKPQSTPSKGAKGGKVTVVVTDPPSGGSGTGGGAAAPATPNVSISQPTGPTVTVPASVPAGCSSDATQAISDWIASVPDNSTLRFAAGGCYRIEGTVELRARDLAIDGNGSTFESRSAPTPHRALWRASDSTVRFRNMSIDGPYANGGVFDSSLQWAHGIDLRGTRALIEGVSITDVSGDCVYFGLGASRSSGIVRDSSCRGTGRNGVSVVAGDDILVQRVTTDRVGYIAFDVEPNAGPGNGSQRVQFDSNTIGSYHMKAYTVIGRAPVSDQSFTNNRVVGTGLRVGVAPENNRPQRLRIAGNSSDTATGNNAIGVDGVDDLTITGNTIPLTAGTMAHVGTTCRATVSGNQYPGGSAEVGIVAPAC
jgi:hypothetical protein